ncbi:hypothetical protein LZK98_11555 [Sphingomonas cannabina]|uniref:hypothetical protein n=1 Tax=Sphingomonas cannabina TaxID=2899123 RepID=UPI001F2B6DE7|nr:hypothetical protein [Sphingomonas cannabina]UIJ43726.1 hypothetical protein LZK98_11555 [Sphingomonas cannabina]
MRGAVELQRRAYRQSAWQAQWIGVLAQADPRKQPSIDKMLGNKPKPMTGEQIDAAMRAWAAAVNVKFAA